MTKTEKTKRLRKLLLFAGLGLILVISAVFLVKHRKSELAETPLPAARPVPVHTATATKGQLPIKEHYIGTIEPLVFADLSPRATGHVYSMAGDVGDPIQTGEAVAVLDARLPEREKAAIAAELNGAKEALAVSEKAYDRRQALVRKGHVSEEQLDETRRQYVLDRARVKRLGEELAAARLSLQYTRLTAPFDGIITRRMKDPGDLVSPGTPMLRVEKPDAGYKVLAQIPQSTAERLSPGDSAELVFKSKRQDAVIDRIQPAINPGALATIEIRVNEKPFGLLSGATLGVDVIVDQPEGIIIPLSCLLEQEDAYHVFVLSLKQETVRAVAVQLLGKSGNRAIVDGDISAEARLVSGNESMLLTLGDDTPVQLMPPETP